MNDETIKQALEIVTAQAALRTMTEEEIVAMVHNIASSISQLKASNVGEIEKVQKMPVGEESIVYVSQYSDSATSAVKENGIICLECGKSFRILTKRHLALHDLTVDEYKEKYGYHRSIPLVCRSLQRERKEIMTTMKLWERRRGSVAE